MKHHPNPSQNAPSSRASNAPADAHPTNSNPLGRIIDLPSFLPRAPSTSGNSAAAASSPAAAAVSFSAPGMALTHEQNSEPLTDLPSFLRCARPAHDAIKPEPAGTVIPIASANNVATGESAC